MHEYPDTWLALRQISLRLRNRLFLRDFDWQARDGEQWAVLGANGAGKTVLARLISGELHPAGGSLYRAPDIGADSIAWVSFEAQRALCAADARHDIADFLEEAVDTGTTVEELLRTVARDPQRIGPVCERLGIAALRGRGLRFLSSGEARRTLFARALLAEPRLLVLDNPYEGVDAASRGVLRTCVDELLASRTHVLLLTRRVQDIASGFTHVLLLDEGVVIDSGPRQLVLEGPACQALLAKAPALGEKPLPAIPDDSPASSRAGPVFELKDVSARYGEHTVLEAVNLRMDADEHLCLAGPNGCGKSTLLSLLCGDNPRAYGQHVVLFGRQRGSGESVWEIKQRFGIVSNQLHLDYPPRTRARDVVASGFFDTLGLYDDCGPRQNHLVKAWLEVLDLGERADERFDELSFGEQRMMLIARAMVKNPRLLILDEPCSGLDEVNRARVLALIERIGRETHTQLLYVSHESDEMPRCITRRIEFRPSTHGKGAYELHSIDLDRLERSAPPAE